MSTLEFLISFLPWTEASLILNFYYEKKFVYLHLVTWLTCILEYTWTLIHPNTTSKLISTILINNYNFILLNKKGLLEIKKFGFWVVTLSKRNRSQLSDLKSIPEIVYHLFTSGVTGTIRYQINEWDWLLLVNAW